MKKFKEYEGAKKEYIKLNDLNSDNIYTYFNNETVLLLIRRYYEIYTKFLFNKLMGSLRLEVSKEKAAKLVELKGTGSWEFAGMVDMYNRGEATCELGHPIRYVYTARNVENGETLHFGARCVGDFFDLSSEGVKALAKVKDEMFAELKEMIAIMQQDLMEEHLMYECQELGLLYKVTGIEGIKKLKSLNPLIPIVVDFFSLGLPLPKSLLAQVLRFRPDFEKKLEDAEFLGINMNDLDILRNSELSLVSQMFTNSYNDIVENIKKGKTSVPSDFYNFRNVNDINIAISHWVNRNERMLKAQDYFKKQGIDSPWIDIYKFMTYNRLYRENPKIYYGVECLLVFDRDIVIESNVFMPKDYGYKGYQLSPKMQDEFDELISYLATREFLMAVKDIYSQLNVEKIAEQKEKEESENMMEYLKAHLEEEKYANLKGIHGVKDIILKKCLIPEDMSSKQLSYVKSVYDMMKAKDGEVEEKAPITEGEVNNRYTLNEKTDVLAKVQRLQREAVDLPQFYERILSTVMRTHTVSDRQIVQIDKAFAKYILNQEVEETTGSVSSKLPTTSNQNRKWSLAERLDVSEKLSAIRNHPDYNDIPESVRNIFANIMKYKTVSDKQIEVVENTYKRHFGGR